MSELSDADELVQRLRSFAAAYPEDLFPPLTKLERDALPRGTIDRISAAMGRHCSQIMAGAADRLETLEGPGNPTQMQLDAATKPLHVRIETLERERDEAVADLEAHSPGIEQWEQTMKELDTLRAENARLRDALDLIASICAAPPYVPDKTIQKIADEALGNFDALQAEARAALEKP